MDILRQIKRFADESPERAAYRKADLVMTYGELDRYADSIAAYLLDNCRDNDNPIVVYGHKEPLMIASFIGCARAGKAYCPLDISLPADRVGQIIETVQPPVVLSAVDFPEGLLSVTGKGTSSGEVKPGMNSSEESAERKIPDTSTGTASEIVIPKILAGDELLAAAESGKGPVPEENYLRGDQIIYIIFTSGSTGQPKGVQIPYGCLCSFAEWSADLGSTGAEKEGARFLNQAPFSFDLSVMDLYTCLSTGGTLCPLEKTVQESYSLLFQTLFDIDPAIWVSTPSFAELCLADPSFCGEKLTSLQTFLFCGERLTNVTASKLLERFPDAEVINTYGPTESTVAVTDVKITKELCEMEEALPVGRPKPGCRIFIVNDGSFAAEGEPGEIVITGDTLSAGYFRNKETTDKAFRFLTLPDGETVRGYYTGDEGYMRDGMLYYNGRLDLQIKLHGYRIELGDIENNLLRIPGVDKACVVANMKDGRAASLTAAVCMGSVPEKERRSRAKQIREELKNYLPDYMVPKKIVFLDSIPMTANGKLDRRKTAAMLAEK